MITFIKTETPEEGINALAGRIAGDLNAGKKVMWLVAGGTNVEIAKESMTEIRRMVKPAQMKLLTVTQTDERYGEVGHKDSNWQQMILAGFNFKDVKKIAVLRGLSLDETVKRWSKELENAFESADVIIGQFGMGADGHIAGLLPHSQVIQVNETVASSKDKKFTRITITPAVFKHINTAYAFVFGESKRRAVANLRNNELSVEDQPAQLLKVIPDSTFYTDCECAII